MMRYLFLLLMFCTTSAHARPIVADLAQHAIKIDHDFTGTEILLFGARNDAGDIVVVVRGPKKRYVARKKNRVAGIWVNTDSVEFDNTDGFHYVAATRDLSKFQDSYQLSQFQISTDHLKLLPGKEGVSLNDFRKAFIQFKQEQLLYGKEIGEISFWGETLFKTILPFPETIEEGWYTVETYLFNDGQLTAIQTTPLQVRKTGFDAFVYNSAYDYKRLYGVACVLMAIVSGWLGNILFRRV